MAKVLVFTIGTFTVFAYFSILFMFDSDYEAGISEDVVHI